MEFTPNLGTAPGAAKPTTYRDELLTSLAADSLDGKPAGTTVSEQELLPSLGVAPVPAPTPAQLNTSQQIVQSLPPPDDAAKIRRESRARGYPYGEALANPQGAKAYPSYWSDYGENDPVASVLLDPTKAVLVQDEVDKLVAATDAVRNPFPKTKIGLNIESGILGMRQNRLYFSKAMNDGKLSPADQIELDTIKERMKLLPVAREFGGQVWEGIVQQVPRFGRQFALGGLGAAAGGAVGLAAGPGGAAALGSFGASVAVGADTIAESIGASYQELTDEVGLSHEQALPLALISGSIIGGIDTMSTGMLSKFPALNVLKKIPLPGKERLGTAIRAAVKDSRFLTALSHVATDMATEGGSEAVQEVIQILTDYAGAKTAPPGQYNVPSFDEAVARTLVSGVTGAAVGGLAGGAGTLFHETAVKVGVAEAQTAAIENLYAATEGMKSAERAPDVVKAFGDRLGEGGAVKKVTVLGQALEPLLEENKQNPAVQEFLSRPDVARQLETARQTGARVTLSLGDFLAYVRPLDKNGKLKLDIGLNDEMSVREAKALAPDIKKAKEEMAALKARETFVENMPESQIVADVEKKLRDVGATAEGARVQAELVASMYSALARRVGSDAWTEFKRAPLTIGRFTNEQLNTVTLEQASPKDVQRGVHEKGYFTSYAHPESPLNLVTYDDEFNGKPVRVSGNLGFQTGVPETPENIKKYGGQGYSTALYLKALQDAKDAKVGWVSDTTRTEATERMYARLRRLGVPVEKVDTLPGSKFTADRYVISAEDLQKTSLESAWQKLLDKNEIRTEMQGATDAEIEQALSGLQELFQKQETRVRGRITFDPKLRNWFAVTLTGDANLSTFIHESGHFGLELMRKLVEENPDSLLASDLRTLEAWAGVKPGEAWSVDALEKFARGFETYIGEGKAPSAKLEGVFSTLKNFILSVYRSLTKLGAPLTDEVRSVMDRMLATDDEIATRRLELGYFPKDFVKDGMKPEEVARYREMYERGAERAQRALDREAIAALRREKTAEYQKIVTEVNGELDRHPVMALRSWFQDGKRIDGGLSIPELAGKKLDREAVQATHIPGAVTKLAGMVVEKSDKLATGIDPDELAPYFGFKNGGEMIDALTSTPARERVRAEMVKERMRQKYPAYGDPGWVEKTAVEKLHGEDSIANAIELELRTIYAKLNQLPPKSPAAVARMAARQTVLTMTKKEMDLSQFREAESRAARDQMKAWAAKDFQTAAEAARRRLYARSMWEAANEARKKITTAEKYISQFADTETLARLGRSSSDDVDGDRLGGIFRDAAANIVEALGLREKSDASKLSLDAHLQKLESIGLPVAVDPMLREEGVPPLASGIDYTRMMRIRDALKNIAFLASEQDTIRLENEAMSVAAVAQEVEANLEKSGLAGRLGQEGMKDSKLRSLRAQIAKPETIVLDIDGGKPGVFHKIWFGTAEAGQFERDRRFRKHRAEIREIAKKYRPDDWSKQMNAKHKFVDGMTYTGEEVFAMLLNLGSESNRNKLILGMERAGRTGWTYDNVVKFVHEVFPDAKTYAYAQAILDYISQSNLWEDSAKVSESISGVRPDKVESISIPTPDGGEIAGGYYPVVYDRKVPLRDIQTTRTKDGLDAMSDANLANLYASHGFTEGRTGYVAPLLLNPRALAAHIYEVDHFISNAPGIIARHRLLTNPKVKAAIVNSLGFDYWDQLRLSNNYIAADGKMLTRELLQASKMVDKLIYHNALMVMGGNVLSGINQIVSGVPATLAQLGPKGLPAFGRALIDFVRSPWKTWEDVAHASGEIEGMEFHYDRDLRLIVAQELGGEKWQTLQSRIAATTMTPVVFGQKLVNVITWKAAYNIALDEGRVGEDAVRYANSAVRQSQSSSGPKDMTAVQRSKDGLMRVLTSLASYTFTLNDMVMPRRLTSRELAGHTGRLVMLMLTSMMAKALFDQIFPKLEEKDAKDRKGLEKMAEQSDIPGLIYAVQAMDDVLYNVPVVGRVGQALVSGREAKFASWVDTGIKALESTPDAFSDKGLTKAQLKAVVETVGMMTGTPTRNVLFGPAEFWTEYADGNIDPSPWAFFQELALARAGKKGDHGR